MSDTNKYEGREFLFNDGRGNLFSKVYFKDPYNNPTNQEADDIIGSTEYNIMTSEYYTKKQAQMNNNDIHYEFTDLIIKAALLHRNLDKSSEIGTRLNSARTAINIYSNLLILGTSDGTIITSPGFLYHATVGSVTKTGSHFLKLIAEYLTDSAKSVSNTKNVAELYATNMINGVSIIPHSEDSSVEYTLGEILDIIHNEIPTVGIKNIIKSSVQKKIDEFINRIYAHVNQHRTEFFGGDANETFNFYNDEINLKPFAKELENVVMTDVKSNIIKYFNQHTNLSNPTANQFWKNVYLKWNMMDKQTQLLYSKVISLQKIKPSSSLREYTDVKESEYKNQIPDTELSNYRLNLKKASDGTSRITQFEHLLPFVPSKISGFWYTDYNGTIQKYKQKLSSSTKKNLLKLIYNGVYFSKSTKDYITVNIGKDEIKLPLVTNVDLTSQFSLNVDKLIRKRLYLASKLFSSSGLPLTKPSNSAQYIDLEYKNIWTRDSNGNLVKKVNGKNVIYGEMDDATIKELNTKSNCFTTQLKFNDSVKCDKYIHKCLLDDDAEGLDECLNDYLKNNNFFKVAENEVDNMHPLIALRTLQKFGFHAVMKFDNKAQVQLKKIQSIDDWLNGFMAKRFSKSDMQKVFTGSSKNTNLLTYLKLVVNHVNRNPAILNKDFKGSTEETKTKLKQSPPSKPPNTPELLSTDDISRLKVHLKTDYEAVTNGKTHIDERNGLITGPFGSVYSRDYGLIPPFLVSGYASSYNIPGMRPADLYGVKLTSSLNDDKYMSFSQFQEKMDSGYFIGAKFFGDLINHHLDKLKESGKELIKEDTQKIQQMLQNQLKLENELIKTIKYFEEYRKQMDLYKNYKSETISEANIVKLVDNKSKLLAKKASGERTLVELLAAIDAIDKNANDGSYTPINMDFN